MGLIKTAIQKLTGQQVSPEQVWVDTGEGDVVAIIGDENRNAEFIHQLILMNKSDVKPGMKVLDSLLLREYNIALKYIADKRNKIKVKQVE